MRRYYLVCYDVSDEKRLRKVHKAMLGYGDPLQYSVFRCLLSYKEKAIMIARMTELLNPPARPSACRRPGASGRPCRRAVRGPRDPAERPRPAEDSGCVGGGPASATCGPLLSGSEAAAGERLERAVGCRSLAWEVLAGLVATAFPVSLVLAHCGCYGRVVRGVSQQRLRSPARRRLGDEPLPLVKTSGPIGASARSLDARDGRS